MSFWGPPGIWGCTTTWEVLFLVRSHGLGFFFVRFFCSGKCLVNFASNIYIYIIEKQFITVWKISKLQRFVYINHIMYHISINPWLLAFMTDRLVNRSPLDPPKRQTGLSSAANLLQLQGVIAPVLHLPILQQCGWDKLSPVFGRWFFHRKRPKNP